LHATKTYNKQNTLALKSVAPPSESTKLQQRRSNPEIKRMDRYYYRLTGGFSIELGSGVTLKPFIA